MRKAIFLRIALMLFGAFTAEISAESSGNIKSNKTKKLKETN